jgi:sterol desaturase/sphingolipid hydroxylase (fatty acid hydroxylase superfamily)
VNAAVPTWERVQHAAAERAKDIALSVTQPDALTMVAGVAIVIAIEVAVMGYPRSTLYRLLHPTRSTRTDIFWTLLKLFGLNAITLAAVSLGLTVVATRLASKVAGFHLLDRIENPYLRTAFFLVATDFVGYWVHRARHQIPWWWEFHKAHHAATEFNGITANRGHPFDGVAIVVASAIPFALLGGSIGHYVPWLTILAVHSSLTHSALPWSWGWFGKYVLYSPIGHRIHHSANEAHRDTNFAGIFPIWDHLFGTHYQGDEINEDVGVDDNYQNQKGLWFDMVESTRRALATVRRRSKSS